MCYILAKRFSQSGCVAFKTKFGKELSNFASHMQKELGEDIEIVAISNPEAYGEYKPYHFVNSFDEFSIEARRL